MSELFSCKLDALVKEELSGKKEIYSSIQIKRVHAFKTASYVMISPNPESDVIGYMERWAANSGLTSSVSQVTYIGWDFPFVSQEQQNRFGMHGYVAACIIPEGFETDYQGVQYSENKEADYAVITIKEPFVQPFDRIPKAYQLIMEYLRANNFKEKQQDHIISCFEHEYTKDEANYMDVFVHVDGVTKVDAFSGFN